MSVRDNIRLICAYVKHVCERIRREDLLSLPVVVLLFPTLTVLFAVAGFLVGKPATKWCGVFAFVVSFTLIVAGAESLRKGIKRSLIWAGILLSGFLLTALLFMNDATDAKTYHTPATLLLAKGWNPVLDATPDSLEKSMGIDLKMCHSTGVIHYAKIGWIWGAVAKSITGNVSASVMASFFLMVCLGVCLCRAHRCFFSQSKAWKWLLVVLGLNFTCVNYMLAGLVDYIVYASLLICVLSAAVYLRTQSRQDLALFGLAAVWLVNAKVSGLVFYAIVCVVLLLALVVRYLLLRFEPQRVKQFACVMGVAGMVALFVGTAPYLTNWIHFGGPAYPQQTFHPVRAAVDPVKADLAPSGDAAQVGYVGKVVGSWFSEPAVVAWHRVLGGQKTFALDARGKEAFKGLGTGFKLLMCISVIMLLCAKRSEVDIAVGLLFLTAVAMPVYAVGIARYAPQMWAIPFLAAANLMSNPRDDLRGLAVRLAKPLRAFFHVGALAVFCLIAAASLFRFGRYNLHLFQLAANKLAAYQQLADQPAVEVLLADTRTSFSGGGTDSSNVRLGSNLETYYYEESFKAVGISQARFVKAGSVSMSETLLPHQCLVLQDKGYVLTGSLEQSYARWQKAEMKNLGSNRLCDVRHLPRQALDAAILAGRYMKGLSQLRSEQLRDVWRR